MNLINESVFALWYVGVAAKILVFVLLARRRWIDRYPFFSLWMLLSILRSLVLLWLQRDQAAYASFYLSTHVSILVLNVLGAVEAFWKLASQLQRFIGYGLLLMAACAAAGILAAFATGAPGEVPLDRVSRSVGISLAVALIPAVIVFLRFGKSGIAQNAFVHATILAALFGVDAVGWMLFRSHHNVAGAFAIPASTAFAFWAWCWLMRVDREHGNPPSVNPHLKVSLFRKAGLSK